MKNRRTLLPHTVRTSLACGLFALGVLVSGQAEAQIKQPGAHPKYSVELDPHLVIGWDGPWVGDFDDEGFGLGFRATIPIIQQGPIKTINNSMGIGFGGDFLFYGDGDCRGRQWRGYDCDGTVLYLPVVAQWNFWLTPKISVFGEPGFAIRYTSVHREGICGGDICDDDYTDLDPLWFVFWGGGRFLLGDSVGITVRLGWPYLGVGVGFLI